MSFDDPRLFADPMLSSLDSSDRTSLAKLLSLLLDTDRPRSSPVPFEGERAQLAKWLYDQRRRREQYLPAEFFGEPAWDILLILYWARHSQRRLSVSAVCASSGAPNSTALRHIEHLCRTGYVARHPHPTDKRVSWLSMSDDADGKVGEYLDRVLRDVTARPGTTAAH